jgi:mRNA interferase RelE/StbE
VFYQIVFRPAAMRDLEQLPSRTQHSIAAVITRLSENPRPPGVEKLKGRDNLYRVRSGDYRILYQISDRLKQITVVKIGHRRDVYR